MYLAILLYRAKFPEIKKFQEKFSEIRIFPGNLHRGGGGVVTFTKIVRTCACQTSKIWLSLYQFFAQFLTHQNTIFERKASPILTKLGALNNNLPKIHPIYVIWAPSSLMKPANRYTKFCEKAPQEAGTYTYTKSMWEPPGLASL